MSVVGCEASAVGCLLDVKPTPVRDRPSVHTVTNGPLFMKSVMDMTPKVHGMNDTS